MEYVREQAPSPYFATKVFGLPVTPQERHDFDVVCLGETMGQFVPTDGRNVETAEKFALHHAGAESNVAIGLARLGHRVAWVSRLGNDAVGKRIRSAIQREDVETALVEMMDDRQTGIFLKDPVGSSRSVTYYRRDSAASTLDKTDIDRALSTNPRLIHLSGITPALSKSCDAAVGYAIDAARTRSVTTSFDVNYRPSVWRDRSDAAARLLELANASDIVFVGLDEAESLWGITSVEDVRSTLPAAVMLVVKDGPRRAIAFGEEGFASVPALHVDVVESVGAGDAFAAGCLSGILQGHGPAVALRLGHLMARAALTSLSDQGEVLPPEALALLEVDESLWLTHEAAKSQ